ncbi:hypothetical protein [Nonomuraea aurantiaca]|jgi:hypothetical protein|uniref:hypothetical protein n=1 Tax=Nonomuraea aurantiaca TaxID=2878562 RepID=UPI001CD98C8E|nr:hypothetical protein [Nonomuraea aurantiaca]MCA2226565.1 hypothetical protein [Nonomuraea aurantiaca]
MRTRKPAALAATALLTAALVGIATPAHAAPTDCTTGRDGKTVWVYCSGGYGQYRVSIYVINPPTGSWPEYGPCVYPGQRSEYTPYHNLSFLGPGVAYC